jgi:type III secretion system YscD/HrpQ family protein
MSERFVVRVLDGLHRGAEVAAGGRDLLVIGSAADCDVVIADDGVAPHHAAARLRADGIVLRALEGAVVCKGARVGAGATLRVPGCTPFALGDARLAIGERAAPYWALLEGGGCARPNAAPPQPIAPPAAPRRFDAAGARRRAAIACLVAGALLIAVPLAAHRPAPATPAPEARLAAVLAALELNEVQMLPLADGRLVVEGVVPDHARHARLLAALEAFGHRVLPRLRVGDALAQAVQEVFRVNGIAVEARYDALGVVAVSGIAAASARVAKVTEHALRDVPGLASIRLEGVPERAPRRPLVLAANDPAPAAGAPAARRAAPNAEAMGHGARRITVVVQGEQPYVVTANGMRYAVGATLPHGYRIAAITGSSVRLERDGEVVVRVF